MAKQEKPFIFIDTCSLLDSCWNSDKNDRDKYVYSKEKDERFWGREFASLIAMGEVIIPKRNYDELVKHANNPAKPELAERAQHALERVERYYKDGTLQIVGDANDPFADAIMLSVALKFKTQRHLAFVTQDRGLAEDLRAICHFRSLSDHYGHPKYDIKIRRITKTGELKPFNGLEKALRERYQEAAQSASSPAAKKQRSNAEASRKERKEEKEAPKPKKPRINWWDA